MAFWDPNIQLELDEGEQILFMSRRHWVMLLRDGSVPLVLGILSGSLAVFRSIGGSFLVGGGNNGGVIDAFSIVLMGIIVLLVYLWQRTPPTTPGQKSSLPFPRFLNISNLYLVGIALLSLIVWFRFQGGQIFAIDPANAWRNDPFTTALTIICVIMALYFIYVLIDWRDNTLILTTTRVIYDDEQFLVRHVQQQMLLWDVQQVSMRQNTYASVIFGYGALTIQSFSVQKIEFTFATYPREMQQRIQAEINKARKQVEPNLLRRLIEEQVYDGQPRPIQRQSTYVRSGTKREGGPIAWLFPTNPMYNQQTGEYTWRPSSVYVLIQLIPPISTFFGVTTALWLLAQFSLIPAALSLPIWLITTAACAFWVFWLREELVNDVYILSRREIVDVDKRPFGPINRRSAQLDRIQNISFDVSFIESLLGFGTVKIQTGASGDFSFNHVPDPRGVQATINDYLTDYKKTKDERDLQTTLNALREYHALQKDHGEVFERDRLAALIAEQTGRNGNGNGRGNGNGNGTPAIRPQPTTIDPETLRREARHAARAELLRILRTIRNRRPPEES
ncbi:MAG TPA: PH domain-containing protein [Roseiflexaceae bacterium]|nr:PH domain-containing protein [Roseiflexaceae bacterium]HMP41855.1 PH domain-containing protein [Roseiflexaceae bacterium]